jgi:hypothetical protein
MDIKEFLKRQGIDVENKQDLKVQEMEKELSNSGLEINYEGMVGFISLDRRFIIAKHIIPASQGLSDLELMNEIDNRIEVAAQDDFK